MTNGQLWNPEQYAATARFVADLAMSVVELLAPRPGERILDLGCGDGYLTEQLARLGCEVVGIDSSAAQIAAAKARGIAAYVADGCDFNLGTTFDAVFSNAALHWMKRPADVLRCVHRALRPGGRFVGEFGGQGNTATVSAALKAALARRGVDFDTLSPWYFPGVDEYRHEVTRAGFQITSIALIPRPTELPGDLVDWLEMFAGTFVKNFTPAERGDIFAEVRAACRPKLCIEQGRWTVDYVRLRFAATKPSE